MAKITGSDYATAIAFVNQATLNNVTTDDASMRTELNKLRTGLPKCAVHTYTYQPLVGITSETNSAKEITSYQYDGYERLQAIRDQDNNILKKICYNYAGTPSDCSTGLFYNPQLSKSFTSNNCSAGYVGVTRPYIVPAYKYSASSIAAATQLAQNDIDANGQNYVNANAGCQKVYYNIADTGAFSSNSCGSGTIPSQINYIVPANTYSSLLSQQDADNKADSAIHANGQNYANTYGACIGVSFDMTIANLNYPNDAYSHITVTLQNNSTGQTYSTGSITPPASVTLSSLPGGFYTVTFHGATYAPNTGIGIFQGYDHTNPVYCSSSQGTLDVTINNVELDNGQQYYFSQISSCDVVAAPAAIQKK